MNKRLLKAEIVKNDMTVNKLAQEIGMSSVTFYRKMKSGKFGLDEAERIINVLGIKNPVEIFFSKEIT